MRAFIPAHFYFCPTCTAGFRSTAMAVRHLIVHNQLPATWDTSMVLISQKWLTAHGYRGTV